jgi:hypothetical protein
MYHLRGPSKLCLEFHLRQRLHLSLGRHQWYLLPLQFTMSNLHPNNINLPPVPKRFLLLPCYIRMLTGMQLLYLGSQPQHIQQQLMHTDLPDWYLPVDA